MINHGQNFPCQPLATTRSNSRKRNHTSHRHAPNGTQGSATNADHTQGAKLTWAGDSAERPHASNARVLHQAPTPDGPSGNAPAGGGPSPQTRLGERHYVDDSELEPTSEEDEAVPGAEEEPLAASTRSLSDAPCLIKQAEE